jgi:hypothetical protein
MRSPARAAIAVTVAVLACGGPAAGSVPSKKPLLIDLQRQTVGALRLGDPAVKFAFAWAPPDFGMPSQGEAVPEAFQSWRNPPGGPWAVVSFTGDDQQHASAIFYRGPFKTTKGDTNGTPLGVVLEHWPSHGAAAPYTPSALGGVPRALLRVHIGRASFFFDTTRHLVAVQVGEGTASDWMNWKR